MQMKTETEEDEEKLTLILRVCVWYIWTIIKSLNGVFVFSYL